MEDIQKTLASLPHEPGVYLYHNADNIVIYVGKAIDVSRRVKQYFQTNNTLGEKTKRLVADITSIEIIRTISEYDALLLEAKLIRKYMPKYNVISRDDKSPLYVVITLSEELPRILYVRKGELGIYEGNKDDAVYGPFQSGYTLRSLLRQLRSIVPYCTQKERSGKRCFYTHLGLCEPCPGEIVMLTGDAKKTAVIQYRKHMLQLRALFEGRTTWVVRGYEREMKIYANALQFEKANIVKQRLLYLNHLSAHRYDPQVFLDVGATDIYEEELIEFLDRFRAYYPTLTTSTRIECFDISNLYGEHAVGSMVVLIHGRPEKGEYRKFRIKTIKGISDVAMMQEILRRRFKHTDWPYPDVLLVDGGKPQVEAARAILNEYQIDIPLAGLAKREEELVIPNVTGGFNILRLPLSGRAIKVVMRIRDEAHRFAITYHRLLRNK